MRLELTRVGLLVELANHYTTRGACCCRYVLAGRPTPARQCKIHVAYELVLTSSAVSYMYYVSS